MADPYEQLAVDPYAALAKQKNPSSPSLSDVAPQLTIGNQPAPQSTEPKQRGVAAAVGRIGTAVGEAVSKPFEGPLGLPPEVEARLSSGPLRLVNNVLAIQPAKALDAALKGLEALSEGSIAAITQTAEEVYGRDVANKVNADLRLLQTAAAGTTAGGAMGTLTRPKALPRSAEVAQAFERQGVTPTAGAVSGSRTLQTAERAISATPGGTSVMQKVTEKTVDEASDAARRAAQDVGSAQSPQVVGGQLRQAAERAGDRYARRREELDTGIERTIGADTVVGVENAEKLLTSLKDELAKAPQSRAGDLGPAIMELENLMADAKGGVIPFGQLRKIRTRLGRDLDRPDISGYRPGSQSALSEVYGVLSEDIKAAAKGSGPEAERALALHDRYVRYMRTINLPVLDELIRLKTDEQVYNWALAQGKIGGTRIRKLRANLRENYGEDVWDEVVSTVVSRMGDATPGRQGVPSQLLGPADTFSVDAFLTNFSKMSQEAKEALFQGDRYGELRQNLDDLVTVTASLKDAEKMTNFSNTTRGLLYATLGGAAVAAGAGRIGTAASIVGSSVVAPWVAGRLITSPRFVKWLAAKNVKNPSSLRKHIVQLAAVAGAEPYLQEELRQYAEAIRNALPPESLTEGGAPPAAPPDTIRGSWLGLPPENPPMGGMGGQVLGIRG